MATPLSLILPVILGLGLACGDKGGDSGVTGDGGAVDGGSADGGAAGDCVPEAPTCEDDLITDLSLQDDEVSDGDVTTTTDGDDFVTVIDASAGGYNSASTNPWVYVKFTDSGAEKIKIDDEAALDDLTWDLSLRRYIIRVNGGDSGSGCVGAIPRLEDAYADITAVPDGIQDSDFEADDFYTDDCTFINDSSGLEGSPSVVLGPWWEYPNCVATTMTPFLVKTSDGTVIKMVVESYYESGQSDCNDNGVPGSNSAIITIRWRKLQ